MPPNKKDLADAWDDDWENLADVGALPLVYPRTRSHSTQKEDEKPEEPKPEPKLTKAQLKAKHIELNKQLWESAYVSQPHRPKIEC